MSQYSCGSGKSCRLQARTSAVRYLSQRATFALSRLLECSERHAGDLRRNDEPSATLTTEGELMLALTAPIPDLCTSAAVTVLVPVWIVGEIEDTR